MEPLQLQDVVLNSGIVYYIQDSYVELFSSDTCYGWKTVAEVDKTYHYLNDEIICLATAIKLWEFINKRTLSDDEVQEVMADNLPRLGA